MWLIVVLLLHIVGCFAQSRKRKGLGGSYAAFSAWKKLASYYLPYLLAIISHVDEDNKCKLLLKHTHFCPESHMCAGFTENGRNCQLNVAQTISCASSFPLAGWKLHGSLMAHSTPYSPHSDPACDPYVCQHQKTHVQTTRWPLQSGPWCYLLITTCHPSTRKPLRKGTNWQTCDCQHW